MNKMLKILCLTLLINTNVYASNTIRYNNGEIIDFNTGATNYLTNNTKTHFDLRDIMKDAIFSYKDDKVVATFNHIDGIKYTTNQSVIIKGYGKSLDGHTRNGEQINTNIDKNSIDKNNVVDKYDKISFLIDRQYTFSTLNLKLNDKSKLNEVEENMISIINSIKTSNKEIRTWNPKRCLDGYKVIIKNYSSEPYEIPSSLRYDVGEIKKNDKIKNLNNQLKLDIYKQIQDMKKYSTQYDEEFKVLHMYFINRFYKKIKIACVYTNDGKEKHQNIISNNNSISHEIIRGIEANKKQYYQIDPSINIKANEDSSNNVNDIDKLQHNTSSITTNKDTVIEKKIATEVSKKIKKGAINILKSATFTNKNQETKPQRTNFNIISMDKNDINEEDQKDHVFTNINWKDITEPQIYTKYGMSNTNAHKIAELEPA